MSNNPVFDPIFNTAPLSSQDIKLPERTRYRFDGWSYEPLVADQEKASVQAAEPRQ